MDFNQIEASGFLKKYQEKHLEEFVNNKQTKKTAQELGQLAGEMEKVARIDPEIPRDLFSIFIKCIQLNSS